MTAKWGSCLILAVCMAITAGCRTPQPNLKPDPIKENLVEPPQEARYDTPGYPKQAFDPVADPAKALVDNKNGPGAARSMTSGGMGGLPGR